MQTGDTDIFVGFNGTANGRAGGLCADKGSELTIAASAMAGRSIRWRK